MERRVYKGVDPKTIDLRNCRTMLFGLTREQIRNSKELTDIYLKARGLERDLSILKEDRLDFYV